MMKSFQRIKAMVVSLVHGRMRIFLEILNLITKHEMSLSTSNMARNFTNKQSAESTESTESNKRHTYPVP